MWTFIKNTDGNMEAIRTDKIESVAFDLDDCTFTVQTESEKYETDMSAKEIAAVLNSLGIPVKAPEDEEDQDALKPF